MIQPLPLASLAIVVALITATPSNAEIIQLTSVDFHDMAKAGEFNVIVDTRTLAEWETSHIENATFLDSLQNADTADEIATIADLNGCENCPIVLYCRSGSRAQQALQKLELAGFQGPLYNGLGVNQWVEAGYELVDTPSLNPPCKKEDPEAIPTCAKSSGEGTPEKTDPPMWGNGFGISDGVNVTVNMPDELPLSTQETYPPKETTKPSETDAPSSPSSAMTTSATSTVSLVVVLLVLMRW